MNNDHGVAVALLAIVFLGLGIGVAVESLAAIFRIANEKLKWRKTSWKPLLQFQM